MTPGPDPRPVQRRRVYYFAGFDTRGARSYHQLYQTEAARQQATSGRHCTVGPAETSGEQATDWAVTGDDKGQQVHTRYRFMAWNDIIRSYWPSAVWRVLLTMPAFYWHFIGCGAMAGTRRLWRPFYWMVMLPLWMTLAGVALGGLAAALVGWAGPGGLLPLAAPQQALLSALAAAAAGLGVLALVLQRTEQWRVFWLMRAWHFLWDWSGRRVPALEQRLDAFADAIQHDLDQESAAATAGTPPADEVLLIGHSAGALSALSVAARWLERCGAHRPPQVKLVTLGQVHPFFGLIPHAGWYREQLQRVAASGMTWVDLSAPADPLCYALVDPLAACGFPPAPPSFLAKSSRFDRMFSPQRYAEVRRDFFRIHFQYLMASEKPVDNDYFQLTAGPLPLDLARLAPKPAH